MKSIDRINNTNILILNDTESYYSINKSAPVSNDEITHVEKQYSLIFPDSLRLFWSISNGLVFNEYGGTRINSLQETASLCSRNMEVMKKGVYFVGVFDGDTIAIDSKAIESGDYIYCGDEYSLDMFWTLGSNFELLIEKLIQTGGNKYWDWTPWDKDHRYNGPYVSFSL
jgi:hypothetical protein